MIKNIKNYLINLREIWRQYHPISLSSLDYYFIPGNNKLGHSYECLEHNYKNISNEKIVVFISSKNNYFMLENELLVNTNFSEFLLINIDDNSNIDQKKLGKEVCARKNIIFLANKESGLQWGLKTLVNFLDKNKYNAKMILHCTHDNYPINKNFKETIGKIANSKTYLKFGLIGFNHLDYRMTRNAIKAWKRKKQSHGLLGRILLIPRNKGENWYNQEILSKNPNMYKDVFSVEAVSDMAFLINRELFSIHITPSTKFKLHLWADDISLQFMKKNIFNVVNQKIFFFNCQELKRKYKISVNSVDGAKKNTSHFGSGFGEHLMYWENKWGWSRDYQGNLNQIKHRYKNTIIIDYINHDISKGPLQNFDTKI